MSYILDALRRADSERERASIPGLHAQPVHAASEGLRTRHGPRPWVWLCVGVVVVLVGQGVGYWLLHDEVPPARPQPSIANAPAPLGAEAPAPDSPTAPVDTAALLPSEPRLTEPPPLPAPLPAPARNKPASTAKTPAESASTPEARIYAQEELPDEIRRSLPALQIGGSVYSQDASSRFLMINGLLLHENDKPAPGLVLERIELKSAVLLYKGYRYRIFY